MDLVSVPALRTYYEPIRPMGAPPVATGEAHVRQLNLADVMGKQVIETRDLGAVIVREENAAGALEVMSRYAVDPRWLIHLPPTMSPPETSQQEGWLERPEEALAYYSTKGVASVVVEEKHMGSRALIMLARTKRGRGNAASGIADGSRGIIVTRTGRRFFNDADLEAAALHRLDEAMVGSGLGDELATDWVLWDAEIMPWSMKAGALVHDQYAPVGAAAIAGLGALEAALAAARGRGVPVDDLATATTDRLNDARRYRDAYNPLCRPVWRHCRSPDRPLSSACDGGSCARRSGQSVAHGAGASARRRRPGAARRNSLPSG